MTAKHRFFLSSYVDKRSIIIDFDDNSFMPINDDKKCRSLSSFIDFMSINIDMAAEIDI